MTKNGRRSWSALWREALVATALGWELALPIFSGVLLGYYLDRWLGTGHIFTLGLLMLGIGIGFYSVGRFIHRMAERDREDTSPAQQEEDGAS